MQAVWDPALGTWRTCWPKYGVRQDSWPARRVWEASDKLQVAVESSSYPRHATASHREHFKTFAESGLYHFFSFLKMKNHTEMIISLLLWILINDHSVAAFPPGKLLTGSSLPSAPRAPSRSTDWTEEFGIIRATRKGGSSLKICSIQMQVTANWAFSLRRYLFSLSKH